MKTRQAGFTLMEVLLVIAVIGILAAIGIPNYIGWRNSAMVREAQQAVATTLNRERAEAKRGNLARRLTFTASGVQIADLTPNATRTVWTAGTSRTVTWPNAVTASNSPATPELFIIPPYGEVRPAYRGSGTPKQPWDIDPITSFNLTVTRGGKTGVVRVTGVFGKTIVR